VFEIHLTTIVVGNSSVTLHVHGDLLCHYSSYFRGALNGPFKESQTREITLDDESPDVFRMFVRFPYTRELCSIEGGQTASN